MQFKIPLLATLAVLGFSIGCASSDEKPTNTVIKQEVGEVSNPNAPWDERKNEFINQSDRRINAISEDVNRMEKSKNNLAGGERNRASSALDETKDLLSDVKAELGDLKKVNAEDWEEERLEFLSKLNKLEEKYTTAKNLTN